MRRVRSSGDSGVATLFVVLMLPLLLLFGALVFDGGRSYLAHRQTQNAADAGALAKATDCALSRTGTVFTSYQTNGAVLANTPACGSGTTTVAMKKTITYVFAPGGGGGDVTRSAIANWGSIGSASTLPITISNCEFTQALLDGTTDITLYLDDAKPQTGCSSLPGGFSQLVTSGCGVTVTAGGTVAGQTGAPDPRLEGCITNSSPPALPHDILIPMYDAAACKVAGCTGKGPYTILGFAEFHVTGYNFTGNSRGGTLDFGNGSKCPDDKNRGNYCIRGDFIRFVISQGTPGGGTDFGVYRVYLAS